MSAIKHVKLFLITVLLAAPALAEDEAPAPLIQVFLGSLKLDDQVAGWNEIEDTPAAIDFPSSLLSGGAEGEYTYGGSDTWRWGINPGGSIAWKSSDTRISGGFTPDTGGTIRFDIDNALFIGELHLGVFLRAGLMPKLSAYVGAGPMLMYAKHEVEDEDVGTPEPGAGGQIVFKGSEASDFDVGYYGRAGLDYRYARGKRFGIGVRYMSAQLDFTDTIGKLDMEGPQFILSYTARL